MRHLYNKLLCIPGTTILLLIPFYPANKKKKPFHPKNEDAALQVRHCDNTFMQDYEAVYSTTAVTALQLTATAMQRSEQATGIVVINFSAFDS